MTSSRVIKTREGTPESSLLKFKTETTESWLTKKAYSKRR